MGILITSFSRRWSIGFRYEDRSAGLAVGVTRIRERRTAGWQSLGLGQTRSKVQNHQCGCNIHCLSYPAKHLSPGEAVLGSFLVFVPVHLDLDNPNMRFFNLNLPWLLNDECEAILATCVSKLIILACTHPDSFTSLLITQVRFFE